MSKVVCMNRITQVAFLSKVVYVNRISPVTSCERKIRQATQQFLLMATHFEVD